MDIKQSLDELAEIQSQLDVLHLREEETIAELIPDDIKTKIKDAKLEFGMQRESAEQNAAELREQIKAAVLAQGKSEKGTRLQAVFVKGRVTWDTKGVEGYALAHPELFAYKREGEPSVSFKSL